MLSSSLVPKILTPLDIGEIHLHHRIVMAPLTRRRADSDTMAPRPIAAEYYRQRATRGGLIIAEATQISPRGQALPSTPGIYSKEQVEGWKKVTQSVHDAGGFIFLQLWHTGRVSNSSYNEDGSPQVGPSAIAAEGKSMKKNGELVDHTIPRALELDEIKNVVIKEYEMAALNARLAGFDGVEVHSANGYLLQQFLENNSNLRSDEYGGSIENRSRLLFEVIDACKKTWGEKRVGVRLSPFGTFNSMADSDPKALYTYILQRLNAYKLAYLHLVEPRIAGSLTKIETDECQVLHHLSPLYTDAPIISAGGFVPRTAIEAVNSGACAGIAFGRFFISNPDLPLRILIDHDLSKYDRSTFYTNDTVGYLDLPYLSASAVRHSAKEKVEKWLKANRSLPETHSSQIEPTSEERAEIEKFNAFVEDFLMNQPS